MPFDDEEHLIGVGVTVPHVLPLNLRESDIGVVDLSDDARAPQRVEHRKVSTDRHHLDGVCLVHELIMAEDGWAIASYIAVVAAVTIASLRDLWAPQGPQWLADVLLHYVMPLGYLAFWLVAMHKAGLCWYDPLLWLIYPLFYLGFVLVRGKMSGFYPYPFIDAKTLGYAGVAANTAGLLVVFAAIGFCLVMIGWWLSRRQPV